MTSPKAIEAVARANKPRVRTVEYDPGWGWIARDPYTGREIMEGFRWRTRDVARTVVDEVRTFERRVGDGKV